LPPYLWQVIGRNLLRAYLPAFCRHCDLVIAPSPSLVGVLSQLGITSRVKVIPTGIDLMPFQKPAKQLNRQALGLTAEALVLIYLGRLSPEKNLGFLLRAFAAVAAAQPHVVLLLVGEGPETDNLRREAQRLGLTERVKFLGKIPYNAVPDHLALADIFITASQTETQCLSLVEALAGGLPVLGIDSPGVRDAIVDGENGLLSTPEMAVFTDKLRQLVTKPDLRRGLAEKARTTAEKYDINRTAQAILTEYEALAARATSA
jgi:glycosyltransferase involved in cell wall biosynthesis